MQFLTINIRSQPSNAFHADDLDQINAMTVHILMHTFSQVISVSLGKASTKYTVHEQREKDLKQWLSKD